MFICVYSSSNGRRYMKIIRNVRQRTKIQQRYLQSLGAYDKNKFRQYRAIVADWKHLNRSQLVLEELEDESGHLQGRGFFKAFRKW